MIKRIFFTTLVLIVLTMAVSITASAQEYIVKMKDNGVMLLSSDVEPLYAAQNLYVTDEETAKALLENGMAERISRDFTIELFSDGYETLYETEYTKCPSLATINAEAAWNYETFGNDVIVGVIDSGCYAHSELEGRLLPGKNFVDGSDNTTDTLGHGTHVSGIIAAALNGSGVAGVATKAKIVPLRSFIGNTTNASNVISAIYAGVDEFGCQILNLSFGFDVTNDSQISPEDAEALEIAIEYAVNQGVIVVAAVGNSGDSIVNYPAGYDEYVIGVGAVDDNRQVCSFSQKNDTPDVFAPGWYVWSLDKNEGEYSTNTGTSMACPHVSAAAAIALSFDPTLTSAEVRTLITSNTESINGTWTYNNAGVLNISKMVDALLKNKEVYTSPLVTTENGMTATVFNLGATALNGSAIWYDKNSGGVTEQPFTVSAEGRATLTSPFTSTRLFVWNSLNDMIPLTQAR